MKRKAIERIREAYEMAARMQTTNLKGINRPRPPKLRYSSHSDLVRDFLDRAGAMLELAGEIGLVTSQEAAEILREASAAHPELDKWLMS